MAGTDAAKNKGGRPRRRDWQRAYLEALEKNGVAGLAQKTAQVSEATVRRERQRNEEFALAEHDARERALDALEAVLRMRATSGQPIRKTVTVTRRDPEGKLIEETVREETELLISTTAAFFLLKRWRPEYRESFRVESSGPGGGPIQHEHRVERSLEDFYAELDRLAASNGDVAEMNGTEP